MTDIQFKAVAAMMREAATELLARLDDAEKCDTERANGWGLGRVLDLERAAEQIQPLIDASRSIRR